ncbi:hypothetical protein [Candidatus Nitrospira salsa]
MKEHEKREQGGSNEANPEDPSAFKQLRAKVFDGNCVLDGSPREGSEESSRYSM